MKIILTVVGFLTMFSAQAKTFEEKFFDISHIETVTTEVTAEESSALLEPSMQPYSNPIQTPIGRPAMPDGGLSLIEVANLAWIIIDRNRPTLEVKTKFANALPVVAKDDWQLVTGWKPLRAFKSKVTGTNPFGITVLEFEYMVMMYYGGNYEGKGLYLKNVMAEPVEIKVNWGFNVNVTVKIPSVANIGTVADPVASMLLTIALDVRSMVIHRTLADTYQLEGNGRIFNVGTANTIFSADNSLAR